MSSTSTIEWTEATWNPVTGCTKVSPGCAHCYAETFAERFRGVPGHPYEQGFDLKLWPERLLLPLQWKRPRTIFVNSMSDLLHDDLPLSFIHRVFETMRDCPQHIFQVLTKRSARLRRVADDIDWPTNVWMGVSVENDAVLSRVSDLRGVAPAIRLLSCGPLIGCLAGIDLHDIHWVIVGGESGAGARPMRADWATAVRDQCVAAGVPFFFKRWGAHDEAGVRRGKKASGRLLDGRVWAELPPAIRY